MAGASSARIMAKSGAISGGVRALKKVCKANYEKCRHLLRDCWEPQLDQKVMIDVKRIENTEDVAYSLPAKAPAEARLGSGNSKSFLPSRVSGAAGVVDFLAFVG